MKVTTGIRQKIACYQLFGEGPEYSGWLCQYHACYMMTSSNGSIFRVTGHLCGEFTGEFPARRPVTRSFGVFFDLRLNKRLSKQSWGWWFETLSRPLWRHCDDLKLWLYETQEHQQISLQWSSYIMHDNLWDSISNQSRSIHYVS